MRTSTVPGGTDSDLPWADVCSDNCALPGYFASLIFNDSLSRLSPYKVLLLQLGVKVKVIRRLAILGLVYKVLLATHHYRPYYASHYRPKRNCLIAIRNR